MRVEAAELRVVRLPLRTALRTAATAGPPPAAHRELVLVRLVTDAGDGWGECPALGEPTYTGEYAAGAVRVLADHLVPRLLGRQVAAAGVAPLLGAVVGHPMAVSSLEMAALDAELRATGTSLATHLGAVRREVDCGVVVGIADSVPALVAEAEAWLAEGYRRVKLKVRPGWDVLPVAAVRRAVGDGAVLQVDANGSYDPDDAGDGDRLRALDALGLAMIEQPYPRDALLATAALAARLATPVCLDESIGSARAAADAIALGACSVVCVKAARVGGYLEAVRVHDVARAAGVPAWCGGLLDGGLGRAANLALAALPGFTLPGDLSPAGRWFARDVTRSVAMRDGRMRVPTGPGIGADVDLGVVDELTVHRQRLAA